MGLNLITSRRILRLCEEFAGSGRDYKGQPINVYKNPTSSDYVEMEKTARSQNRRLIEVRFVADSRTKTVYVADSYNSLHEDIVKILNLPPVGSKYILSGLAKVVNGKAVFVVLSSVEPEVSIPSLWTWVDKYIQNCSKNGFYYD